MNSKNSLVWFTVGIVWLLAFGLSFAHAANIVGENLQNGLIWFGASALWGCAGVFGGIKLMKSQ